MSKYRVGSLFSGCGGFDLGFQNAGFEVAWANDIDSDACLTYRKNIGDIIEGDIHNINPKELSRIDVLTAGFPCQPFSNAGSRNGINDTRGNLVMETYRFIEEFLPKVIVYENVRGILSTNGHNGRLIEDIISDLERFGYKSEYKLLNFSHFGVPQNRIRVILIAVRDNGNVEHLFPDIEPYKDLSIESTLAQISPDDPNQNELMRLNPQALHYGSMIPEGGSWKNLPYDVLPDRWKKIRDNMAKYHYPNFYRRYHRSDIMGTITAAFKPENAAVWHPIEDRIYSVREIATFQSFPKNFIFEGRSIKSKYQQIGNAIAPYFVERLARRIKKYLEQDTLGKKYPDSSELNVNRPLHLQIDRLQNFFHA